ncbi:MAG: cytochrome c maturation protein CcmE [Gammaproteobacteria bacterium]
MTPTRRQRVILISLVVSGVAISAGLALKAFQENLLYFFSPTQVEAGEAPESRNFRLGGMVVLGSVTRDTGSMTVNFVVTDYAHSIPVQYTGVLPDLFGEGQGVVVRGQLHEGNVFFGEEVLAKHDENYMSPEVAEALAQSGATREP